MIALHHYAQSINHVNQRCRFMHKESRDSEYRVDLLPIDGRFMRDLRIIARAQFAPAVRQLVASACVTPIMIRTWEREIIADIDRVAIQFANLFSGPGMFEGQETLTHRWPIRRTHRRQA